MFGWRGARPLRKVLHYNFPSLPPPPLRITLRYQEIVIPYAVYPSLLSTGSCMSTSSVSHTHTFHVVKYNQEKLHYFLCCFRKPLGQAITYPSKSLACAQNHRMACMDTVMLLEISTCKLLIPNGSETAAPSLGLFRLSQPNRGRIFFFGFTM